jgi:ATP-dependent DNA helicase RecG
MEKQIIIRSSQVNLLHLIIPAILKLIFPFKWIHSFIPVLPYSNIELLDKPGSYIFGILSDNIPFDTAKTGIVYDENEFKKLHLVAQERKTKISEKELISKNCITEDRYVTKGMELFADDYSGLRTKVVATVWPGLTKGGSIVTATEEYTGNLLSVLERTIDFIRVHSANGFRKISTQTVPYVSYPVRAVTEGVVNAIGHRNYYMSGTQVEINIFPDRLEITSPGALLGVRELYKEKNIASIIPRRRNEVICNLLEMCKYMEKKGYKRTIDRRSDSN